MPTVDSSKFLTIAEINCLINIGRGTTIFDEVGNKYRFTPDPEQQPLRLRQDEVTKVNLPVFVEGIILKLDDPKAREQEVLVELGVTTYRRTTSFKITVKEAMFA